jgi:hypothetical protein
MEFVVKDVKVVFGLNHILALLTTNKLQLSEDAATFYIAQQNNHNHLKSNNLDSATTINGITSSGYDQCHGGVNPRTNVSFSLKDTEKYFEEFTREVLTKVGGKLTQRNKDIKDKLMDKAHAYQDIFWAVPYISIEEGLWSK